MVLRRRYTATIRPFVTDISGLNRAMAECGAVISGSVALHFFLDNVEWTPRDMDIYVPDHTYNCFVLMLKDLGFQTTLQDGFAFMSSGRAAVNGIKEVRRYTSPTGRAVDVLRSYSPSPLPPLYFFWSTLLFNFIGPGGCVCGFPRRTLAGEGVLKPGPLTKKDDASVSRYVQRGFTFSPSDHLSPFEG